MRCGTCGSEMKPVVTSLPFKVTESTIVILKELPAYQCGACSDYLMDDAVFSRVEQILAGVNASAELEIIHYAA